MPAYDTPVTIEIFASAPTGNAEPTETINTWAQVQEAGSDLTFALGGAIAVTGIRRTFRLRGTRTIHRLLVTRPRFLRIQDPETEDDPDRFWRVLGFNTDTGRLADVEIDCVDELSPITG